MIKKLAQYIAEEMKKDVPQKENRDVYEIKGFDTLEDITFSKSETKLLKTLGEDKLFSVIIDKVMLSIVLGTMNVSTVNDIQKRNGGLHALEILREKTVQLQEQPEQFDPLTGEKI